MIQEAIETVVSGRDLDLEEASAVMQEMMNGRTSDAQTAALITALRMKGESVDEIVGMARAMRRNALHMEVSGPVVDTCGTGGDSLGTFNISTAAALVVAAAGLKVAKHGNRALSGLCGSADVLEACGVKVDLAPKAVGECIEEIGIGFMFAPVFHPATRHAARPRREIGIRTVFNILGPLTNPAGAEFQLLGVARPELGEKLATVLGRLGTRHALLVHGEDGTDEMSVTGPTLVWELRDGAVKHYTVTPEEVGLKRVSLRDLKGGNPEENRQIMERVLVGQGGALADAVVYNAAGALVAADAVSTLMEGVQRASEIVYRSEAAIQKLHALVETTQRLAPATAG
jgi:anthranilate phosphoribosyltransferase